MKIVIIGSGNVATHLAKALYLANMQIVQIWSYHYQNASILATQVNAEAIENLTRVDPSADLCLIAVKDDAIEAIANQLKGFKGLIAHTSGAVNIDIFNKNFEAYGVFYPLQTFSKIKEVNFSNIPLCVEANTDVALQQLKNLANRLSKSVVEVNSEKREILHLAAVFACNFTNHLYALAEEILESNDLGFELLRPLINETAAKVEQALPLTVQTGPAIRNDEATLKKHSALLLKQPQLLEIYKTLSESIKKTR
jgi:predicted short-subunit dehydrogenase-like oxidoreductase (DUF2520 family)